MANTNLCKCGGGATSRETWATWCPSLLSSFLVLAGQVPPPGKTGQLAVHTPLPQPETSYNAEEDGWRGQPWQRLGTGAEKLERGLCSPGEGSGPSEGVKWGGAGGRVPRNVGHSCPEACYVGAASTGSSSGSLSSKTGPAFSLCCPSLPITHLPSVSTVPTL